MGRSSLLILLILLNLFYKLLSKCLWASHKLYLRHINMASEEIRRISIKLPQSEYERLEAYCKKTHRGKTEILRELIRSLPDPESESKPEKM
jgi:hypothetical protein